MAEYLVYHGSIMSGRSSDDDGLVSFKSDGSAITVRGDARHAKPWTKIVTDSYVIGSTAASHPERVLWRFMFANKMSSWSYFTDDEGYDKYKDVYEKVKGRAVKVPIVPRESRNTPDSGRRR
jgi:hypothetical protein